MVNWIVIWKKVSFDFCFILYIIIYFKQIVDLDVKDKVIKVLEENMGECGYDFCLLNRI